MKLSIGNRILLWLALLLVSLTALRLLPPQRLPHLVGNVSQDVERLLTQPYFEVGNLPITPVFLFKSFLFLLVLSLVSRLSRVFVQNRVLGFISMDPGQRYAFARVTGYAVFLVGLMVGLQSVGVNLSSLVVVASAVGIGIGLGLQTISSNFVSGLVLLLERPIKLGDRIEVGNVNGDVVRIAARSTWVRTNDNVVIIVPNFEFVSNRVTNWTATDRQVRFSVPLGVSYDSSPEQVRDLLLQIAARHPDVMQDPPPEVLFTGFGDSSLNFELRVWTINQVQTPRTLKSDLYFSIFQAFREHGIEIPFPQRDVHLYPSPATVAAGAGTAMTR